MKRIILSILITLSCALPLLAQKQNQTKPGPCTLGVDRAPELRGFRLGVSQAEVLNRFPGTSLDKPDKFGRSQLRLTVIDTSTISKGGLRPDKAVQPDMTSAPGDESAFVVDSTRLSVLKGVRRIRFQFVDGRLAQLQVAYDDSIKWDTVDEFVESVARALNLSPDWSLPPNGDGSTSGRELRCQGFVITADLNADSTDTRIGAQLFLEDLQASALVEKRQTDLKERAEAAEDAKKKNFKP
ncbi:MAG TPA: hypothetical protein VKD91_17800 [Pyrinomonadaceae bacterium]|nr:hypothetical protein [Pyrinomonadaceae bacterium]